MSLGLIELKSQYNTVLATNKKAEAFFNNPNESMERKEKWLPKFMKITEELSMIMNQYKELTGVDMTTEEALNGFKID